MFVMVPWFSSSIFICGGVLVTEVGWGFCPIYSKGTIFTIG